MERLELAITDLAMVPASAIPRTTSGKVQRKQAGRMLMDGELTVLGMAGPLAQAFGPSGQGMRSEEHTSELQSLMRISYAVLCLKKKKHMHNNKARTPQK